eukprot:CAMPEP_0171133896 /NCGR_PEP_ID=MMETSP0766_2-20121228/127075_1 /TAXON_ID=439317 /ORGANISM="Gambierdiscus australes, Strain CAWD 149" /LENGTH=150 /DNA_ID=CAMNT_0011597307 /DNA_START=81 /DNA_END=534 /DNA_ORIENTATION=-
MRNSICWVAELAVIPLPLPHGLLPALAPGVALSLPAARACLEPSAGSGASSDAAEVPQSSAELLRPAEQVAEEPCSAAVGAPVLHCPAALLWFALPQDVNLLAPVAPPLRADGFASEGAGGGARVGAGGSAGGGVGGAAQRKTVAPVAGV